MTKEDIDIAATLGIPVVRKLSEAEQYEKERYTIYQYGKRYPEAQERKRGKKAVQFVVLLDPCRKWTDSKPELIEPADPEMFEAQKQAYLAGTTPKQADTEKPKARKKAQPFRVPTAGEVSAYALEMLYDMDAQVFIDHYDSCGWVVGKNKPMRDWKAAVRNWVRRQKQFTAEQKEPEPAQSSFETDAFFAADLAKSYGEETGNG